MSLALRRCDVVPTRNLTGAANEITARLRGPACDVSPMHISQLAEISGVPATTLRYYESVGLLTADRDSTGFRIYSNKAVTRLAFITAAKHLGLPLLEIRDLLVACDDPVPAPARVELRRRLTTHLGEAELRVRELTTFTDSLRSALARLDGA